MKMNTTNRQTLLAGLLLTALTATLHADLAWTWSYTPTAYGSDSGSGTFTTGDTPIVSPVSGNTGYLVTSITGSFTGPVNVTSLGTPGDVIVGNLGPVDNLLIPAGGGSAQVDPYGLGYFTDAYVAEFEFYNTGAGIGITYPDGALDLGTLTITEVTPEPASLISAAAVLALLAAPRARKFLTSRPTT